MRSRLLLCFFLLAGAFGLETARAQAALTLPNGLRVLTREQRDRSLVAIQMFVQAGAREERAGEEGCAHFLEHLLFKGTKTRGPGALDREIENLGAQFYAMTGPDYVRFGATVVPAHTEHVLLLLDDLLRHATLPEAEMERERAVILDELAQRASEPTQSLSDTLFASAFPNHAYARSPGGAPASIRMRNRAQLLAFYQRNYRPDRCTLVLTGDLPSERAYAMARKVFGAWQADEAETPERPAEPPILRGPSTAAAEPLVAASCVETEPGWVGIGFPAPAGAEKTDALATQVLAALLAPGSPRLALPELMGVEIQARYTPRRDKSLFLLLAKLPALEQRGRVEAALLRVVADLRRFPPGAEELALARGRVLGKIFLETETCAGLAQAVGYADLIEGDAPEPMRQRLARLTLENVAEAARTLFVPERRVVARVLPRQGNQKDGR